MYFLKLIHRSNSTYDSRFMGALIEIMSSTGKLKIEKDLNTGISPRQLRRYFDYYIGESAKTFSQVVRFQKLLNLQYGESRVMDSGYFYDLGYYDQPHYIKEFRRFYGLTPGEVFGTMMTEFYKHSS